MYAMYCCNMTTVLFTNYMQTVHFTAVFRICLVQQKKKKKKKILINFVLVLFFVLFCFVCLFVFCFFYFKFDHEMIIM